jgi:drug/metabolite transporter (DMT)-like permease
MRIISLTVVAMVAFAANSLLCRQALGSELIDPATFTSVRALSGAVTLVLILMARGRPKVHGAGNWRSAFMLFTYMVFFSFGYVTLNASTGALVLFGTVQLTMFAIARREGERFSLLSWSGLALAAFGLVYLVSPGVTAPDVLGAVLMAVAGISWGFYSLLGRGVTSPLGASTWNFIYIIPFALLGNLIFLNDNAATVQGVALAAVSGAGASACGYVAWYTALPHLTAMRAATVQLSVPAIAAFGGVFILSEEVTLRLIVATAATLGGVSIVLAQRAANSRRVTSGD